MNASSLLIVVAVVGFQVIGGAIWWWLPRRSQATSVAEMVGMSLALGTITSTVSAIVLQSTPLSSIAWALPTIAALAAALVVRWCKGRQIRARPVERQTRGELRALTLGVAVGMVPIWINWRRIPLGTATDSSFLDLYFLQALSNGLARFGGGESILMTGGSLRYHWLSYAWIGEIDQVAGLPAFAGLTRVLPIVALVGVSALAARWSAVLARGTRFAVWVPAVAVLLVVAGGYTGALYGTMLNFDSPSQAMTTLWMLGLLFTVVIYLDCGRHWLLTVIVVLTAATTGGKVSHMAVAAGGLLLLTFIGLLARQEWRWRAMAALGISGVAALITYVLIIRGAAIDRNLVEDVAVKASTWQGLDPLPGNWGVLAGTVALSLATLTRTLGILWLIGERPWRTNPTILIAIGGLGVGSFALFTLRDGINETWFVLAASAPASIVSAVGLVAALVFIKEHLGQSWFLRTAVLVVAVSAIALALSMNIFSENQRPFAHWAAAWSPWVIATVGAALLSKGASPGSRIRATLALALVALVASSVLTRPSAWWTSQRQVFTETSNVVPTAFTDPPAETPPTAVTPDFSREEIAGLLRELADTDDIVFTTNSSTAFVPALTGLRMFLAGNRYQFGLGAAGDVGVLESRKALTIRIIADPRVAPSELCPASVDWLWWEEDVPELFADQVVLEGSGISLIDFRALCSDT